MTQTEQQKAVGAASKTVKAKATEYVSVAASIDLGADHFLGQAKRLVDVLGTDITPAQCVAAASHLLAASVLLDADNTLSE